MRYVLNRRSGVLHRLPASESCNTDAILDEVRFTVDDEEEIVGYIGQRTMRRCTRCFGSVRRG